MLKRERQQLYHFVHISNIETKQMMELNENRDIDTENTQADARGNGLEEERGTWVK